MQPWWMEANVIECGEMLQNRVEGGEMVSNGE